MSAKEILILAKGYIDSPEKWTKGAQARDGIGEPTSYDDSDATCFCIMGAIHKADSAYGDANPDEMFSYSFEAGIRVIRAIKEFTSHRIVSDFNDDSLTSHGDVMQVMQWAIDNG